VPLIVFGTGIVGNDLVKLRGLRHGVTSMFYRTLKEREKESELLVVSIDEFRTSRICNICKTDTLYKASHTGGFGVLVCKTYKTLWQRDVNAFKNMMSIASSIWNQDGSPTASKRV
jgi:transposase